MVHKKGAHLGQHFLTARWAASMIAESAGIGEGSKVLEIGPGTGNLTKELLRLGGTVTAIEKDTILAETLRTRFASEIAAGQFILIEGDVRSFDIAAYRGDTPYVLAANIPYYITGDIIQTFLETPHHPTHMVLLVQKEVAERIARDKKESILSLSVKVFGTPQYVKTVSRGCFAPPPKIDSAILAIRNISHTTYGIIDFKRFFEVVKKGFASKRKMLGGNLKGVVAPEHMRTCDVAPQTRAENVSLEKWLCLSGHSKENKPEKGSDLL